MESTKETTKVKKISKKQLTAIEDIINREYCDMDLPDYIGYKNGNLTIEFTFKTYGDSYESFYHAIIKRGRFNKLECTYCTGRDDSNPNSILNICRELEAHKLLKSIDNIYFNLTWD